MRRNVLFDTAFVLAALAIMLFVNTWAYANLGRRVPGMIPGVSSLMPSPVIVYNITTLLIECQVGWLIFLGVRAIYHRVKKADNRSPELQALDKIGNSLDKLTNKLTKIIDKQNDVDGEKRQ